MRCRPQTIPAPSGIDVRSFAPASNVTWARCAVDPRRSRRRLGSMPDQSHPVPMSLAHDALSIPADPGRRLGSMFDQSHPFRRNLRTVCYRSQPILAPFGHDVPSIAGVPPLSAYDAPLIAGETPSFCVRCAIDRKRSVFACMRCAIDCTRPCELSDRKLL